MKRLVWIVALVLLFVILTGFKSGFRIRNIASSLPKHPDLQYDKRRLDQIDQVIIHHSATPVRASPESIARYHVGPNHISSEGIPGIAYHFLINFSGQVFQVNELTTISWHTAGQNTRSIGICLIGNFDETEPSKAQYQSMVILIALLRRKLGALEIAAHNEYANKTCPGELFSWEKIQSV